MMKRTLYFGNPAYLSLRYDQLVIKIPAVSSGDNSENGEMTKTVPIEDLGVVVLDHQQISITQGLIGKLLENNVALIPCDATHHPTGLLLPLSGNVVQTERFQKQIAATEPLKKNLWQQTVKAKILNQAAVLKKNGYDERRLTYLAEAVKTGDPENCEGRAAAYYWSHIFSKYYPQFLRDRYEAPPNNLLNYGYAILRAVCARALVASGLLPTLGIHHHNRYNAYCLADDIMEPYRPLVDQVVLQILDSGDSIEELNKELKAKLLSIPAMDVLINKETSPLMVGMQRTTQSLVHCYEGKLRRIKYPVIKN